MPFGETKPSTLTDKILEWVGNVFSIIYFITPTIQIILLYKKKLQIENIPMCLLISIVLNYIFSIYFNGFYAKLKSFAVYSFIFKPKICNKCVKFM